VSRFFPTRACRQLSQTVTVAKQIAARKFLAVLSYRAAIARNWLRLRKKFSIRGKSRGSEPHPARRYDR
jgi:hypothetical protein